MPILLEVHAGLALQRGFSQDTAEVEGDGGHAETDDGNQGDTNKTAGEVASTSFADSIETGTIEIASEVFGSTNGTETEVLGTGVGVAGGFSDGTTDSQKF